MVGLIILAISFFAFIPISDQLPKLSEQYTTTTTTTTTTNNNNNNNNNNDNSYN